MKKIEEINSFDDIDNYYEAEIPQFIQEILEERVEALKHCITYKKEIERLHSIIKEVREYIESFKKIYEGHYPYIDTRHLDLNKLLEILDKVGSDKE